MSSELVTDRLRLRWMTEDDAGLMLAIWNDPGFIRHVTDRGIRTVPEARRAMHEGIFRQYSELGYGPYALEPVEGGAPLGICGLFKREYLEDPDLGYTLLPGYRGQGFALEAARAVLAHAREHLGCPRVRAIVAPTNTRSTRLLSKLGMRFEETLRRPEDTESVALFGLRFDVTECG